MLVQRMVIREQGIAAARNHMRGMLLEAENVRSSISTLNTAKAFDSTRLGEELKHTRDIRSTSLYMTVPVVSAWRAIEHVATAEGYEFRVPKFQPRNPKNMPSGEEARILRSFEDGRAAEFFEIDKASGVMTYARPIRLTEDCLACHGDPKNSPTGDGKDILGFQMENWRAGEVHGAFILKAKMDAVDAVIRAGILSTVSWTAPVALAIAGLFLWLTRHGVVRPLRVSIASLRSASRETSLSSKQISAATMALAQSMTEQAASIEETQTSLEQMSTATASAADFAKGASTQAGETKSLAELGLSETRALREAMHKMEESSHDAAKIIKTIDEVAFQTNLLALNAAVEAARAGSAGAGFAVVADEVRRLAQRCAEAARQTNDIIGSSAARTNASVQLGDQVSTRLATIATRCEEVNQAVARNRSSR